MSDTSVIPLVVEDVVEMVKNIPCEGCKASVGEPCRNKDGEPLWDVGLPVLVHAARVAPIWVVYQIGYRHGRRDMKKELTK